MTIQTQAFTPPEFQPLKICTYKPCLLYTSTNTNLKNTDFDVFAFTADGTAFMGKVDTDFGHDGVNIVYNLSLIHI